jgi:hypothetical protein
MSKTKRIADRRHNCAECALISPRYYNILDETKNACFLFSNPSIYFKDGAIGGLGGESCIIYVITIYLTLL